MLRVGVVVVAAVLASAGGARSDEVGEEEEARRLFEDGRRAYDQREFQRAHDCFEKAYLISHRPELLFNIGSALKELGRPHDAAERLRSYLRVAPKDPDRPEIEQRILALEEAQRLLDDRVRRATPPETRAPAVAPVAIVAQPRVEPAPSSRRRTLVIALSTVGAIVVVAGAVGLGVGLTSSGGDPFPPTTLGSIKGTK
jgi:tetratricopeptide (TPR) repeat protein